MPHFTDTELKEEWEKEVDLDDVLQHYIMPNGHKIEEYWLSKFNAYKQSIRAEIEGKKKDLKKDYGFVPADGRLQEQYHMYNKVIDDLLDSPLLK